MYGYGKNACRIILLSYLTVVGVTIDLSRSKADETFVFQLLKAAGRFSVEQLFLFVGLCALYAYAFQRIKKTTWTLYDRTCVVIPAVLFSGFMVVGYSFAQANSLNLILANKVQIIKAIITFAGYGIGFMISIAWLYTWLTDCELCHKERQIQRKGVLGRYKAMLMSVPFRTVFLTLLIIYIPYMIISYPAIFMGDDQSIILQGFIFSSGTSTYLCLIDENVKLNGHHPVTYTLFVHACLVIGKSIFGSYNIGIFLAALSQFLVVCTVVAASVRLLAQMGVHENVLLGVISYFAFAPKIQNYMFLITKDIFSACMMLLFLMSVFRMVQGKTSGKRALVELSFFGIAAGLFRNDGRYIILGSVVIMLFIIKEYRKMLLVSGVTITVCLGLFFDVLMPAFHITPASRREALSVPFQQTARYFRDRREEVTEEEWEAVSAVLDANSIGEKYNPTNSDPVKATFHEEATQEELMTYFIVWFKMGLKHPRVYVQATFNNYYIYFYPGAKLVNNSYSYSWSQNCIEEINNAEDLKRMGCSFHYPEALDSARTAYEMLRERIFELPVFSLLKSSAAYVWMLVILVFYLIKERIYKGLALTIPLVLSVGVCILSPRNGDYFRYLYCVSVCLPVIFLQCLYMCKYSGKKEARHDKLGY